MQPELVLDESIGEQIEKKLNGRSITTYRPPSGTPDNAVLAYATKHKAPVLTRDPGDFVPYHHDHDHYGIIIDGQMHLRNTTRVAETILYLLEEIDEEFTNTILWLSNFYQDQS